MKLREKDVLVGWLLLLLVLFLFWLLALWAIPRGAFDM
jgi:hypothetical protein